MHTELLGWLRLSLALLYRNAFWMGWNLFLAWVPLGLSVWLFRKRIHPHRPSWLWGLGLVVFIAFLPNAPYVLTDVIHLIEDIRRGYSTWLIVLVTIPQYLIFMLAGLQAYVVALINVGEYLRRQGWGHSILAVEGTLHILSAIGIYLGRFRRFNSWDLVTQTDSVVLSTFDHLTSKRPVAVIGLTLIVMVLLYWPLKQVNLAIAQYWHVRKVNSGPRRAY